MLVAADVFERGLRLSLVERGVGLGLVLASSLQGSTTGRKLSRLHVPDFAPRATLNLFTSRVPGGLEPVVAQLVEALQVGAH